MMNSRLQFYIIMFYEKYILRVKTIKLSLRNQESVRHFVIAGVISSQTPIAFARDLDFVCKSERRRTQFGIPKY